MKRVKIRSAVKGIDLPEGLTHKWINCTQPPLRPGIYLRKPVHADGPILYAMWATGHWSVGVNDASLLTRGMEGHTLSPFQLDARFEWMGLKEPKQ